MLQRHSRPLRDWGWFALAAVLPLVAVAALGLRAARNEEAAALREMGMALEGAAQQLQGRYDRTLDELGDAAASSMGAPPALQRAPFADAVVVGPDATLVVPAPSSSPAIPSVTVPKRCRRLAHTLAQHEAPEARLANARREFLERCEGAQSAAGRSLWLVIALDDARGARADATRLEAWLRRYGSRLSPAERTAARDELAASGWLDASARQRLDGLLADSPPRVRDLQALLRSHRGLLRSRAGRSESLRWRDERSVAALHEREDRTWAGYVVHRGAIERALTAGWPSLPAGMKADLVAGQARSGAPAVQLLDGTLQLVISWRDDRMVRERAHESLLILLAVVAIAVAVALAMAAVMLHRMRAERRLSALRTDFVAAVSHELRTPIASLRMLSELLAEQRIEPDERQEIHEALAREARRLGNTVHRLLTFSRMEGARVRASRAEASVTKAVRVAIATFRERHPEARVHGPEESPEVSAWFDEAQLSLALDNLLENAFKHAPDGQPYEVRVRADEREVRVSVQDHGPGIAAVDRERIFAPFERADDRLSEATEGSGIGLALVRHVAQAHQGRAWVDSLPGRGATFTIAWPRSLP